MISALLALLGSSAFGSILGGIFAILNRKADLEAKKLDYQLERDKMAHELAVSQANLEQIKAEAAGRREVAVVEGEATIESARLNAIAATQASDVLDTKELEAAGGWRWALILAEALRKSIRPVATVVLLAFTLYVDIIIVNQWLNSGWAELSKTEKMEAALQALAWLSGQAGAALGYWFVSRGTSSGLSNSKK